MEHIENNEETGRGETEAVVHVDEAAYTKEEHLSVEDNIERVDPEGDELEAVILPTGIYSDIIKTIETLDSVDEALIAENYDAEDGVAVTILSDSLRVGVRNNALVKTLRKQESDWSQVPKYADKVLGMRELAVGSNKPGGKVKGTAATAKFYSHLGLGGLIQIPMWHSGFWITLKAIKESELLNLEMAIANNQITLGRETNTLIFSNYSVVFVRLVTEFITRHIQSCTLELPNLNDVTKFIKVQDLFPLVNGLIQGIYLKGFKDIRSCINSTTIVKETGKPKCSHTMTSIIDPKKLLWVNRRELTKEHFEHMLKRSPNSMTENDVLQYQSTLRVNKPKKYNINTENGSVITIELESPYINRHVMSGERWVNNVIDLTEKLFTENLSVDEKNTRIKTASKMVLLSIYNHFFKTISLDDGSFIESDDDIDEILEIITADKIAYKEVLNSVRDYIDMNTIAIVAIPNYKCPECNESQNVSNVPKDFKDLIPINVLETFFDLSTLKTSGVAERNLD